jgi:hypothetical protein
MTLNGADTVLLIHAGTGYGQALAEQGSDTPIAAFTAKVNSLKVPVYLAIAESSLREKLIRELPEATALEPQSEIQAIKKIFGDAKIMVTATCVRVPIPRAHSESINIEFERPITPQQVRDILAKAPGVKIVDDREANHFPMPLEASGQDAVLVGRIRQDISRDDGRGIELFVAGDQIRKGAATNAVQIAERLI